MTDHFALLDLPRQPWLDLEQLKQAFHAKTRQAHPDAQLNEAYQVLRDPRRRLHHLLVLQGEEPSKNTTSIPGEIEALFPVIASLMRETDQEGMASALEKMFRLRDEALARLRQMRADDLAGLQSSYLLFSYLSRWIAQVEEKQLQLTLSS